MHAELLTIGSELLSGATVNSNAAYLARRLAEAGVLCRRQVAVADEPGPLLEAMRDALSRPGLVVLTGGLGPTFDDLTLDTLAEAADSVKDIDTIITGHSVTMSVSDLKEYAQFNRDFFNDVNAARKAGKSVDEIARSWKIPAKYAGYAAPAEARLKANVQIAFDEAK